MIILEIKVVPSAGESKIVQDKSGMLKCYLKSPPEDGKANRELVTLFSDRLRVPKASVEIISGLASRKKRLKIDRALTIEMIYQALGFEIQNILLLK